MAAFTSFDFGSLFSVGNLLCLFLGTLLGMIVGCLPGLGPTIGVALCLPLTFKMDLIPSVLLLVAIYQGAEYGGSISAILLGIPGTISASATTMDGNPLCRKGYPGKALGYSLTSSAIGGLLGGIVLLLFITPLSRLAFDFLDGELFLIAMFGLISIVTLGSDDVPKSMISLLLGLLLRTMGADTLSGVNRYTFGVPSMLEGLQFIAVITGLFALSSVFNMVGSENLGSSGVSDVSRFKVHVSLSELREILGTVLKSSVIGTIMGIIPGLGPSAAAWMSYNEVKRAHPEKKFGTGEPLGISACESANNACVGGALLPLLSMGIPGSGTIAVLATAFMFKGIQPGPQLLTKYPQYVYPILWGFLIAVFALYIVGKFFTSLTARMLVAPNYLLVVIILVAIMIGSFGNRNNMFDVGVAIAFGVVGFFLIKLKYPIASFLMAFVLGDIIETHFRRALTLSKGSWLVFVSRPASIVIDLMILALIVSSVLRSVKAKKQKAAAAKTAEGGADHV